MCFFGCKHEHEKALNRKRSKKYYNSDHGKKAKKEQNQKRCRRIEVSKINKEEPALEKDFSEITLLETPCDREENPISVKALVDVGSDNLNDNHFPPNLDDLYQPLRQIAPSKLQFEKELKHPEYFFEYLVKLLNYLGNADANISCVKDILYKNWRQRRCAESTSQIIRVETLNLEEPKCPI